MTPFPHPRAASAADPAAPPPPAAGNLPGRCSSLAGPAFPKFRVLDLFSGIGGFSLGLERTGGFETVAFCEIEEFPRRVLKKHWPEVPIYNDVRTLTKDVLDRDGIAVDVITGGFPCQDLSVAGKQRGMGEGTRSGLWSEIIRLVGELRPQYVIVENVANLLSGPSEKRGGWFGRVLGDLAECGYDAEWRNIPAGLLGARHLRTRVWLVAYPHKIGRLAGEVFPRKYAQEHHRTWASNTVERIIDLGGRGKFCLPEGLCVDDGLPDWLGGYGNAVVPQIPELIGRAILENHKTAQAAIHPQPDL